MTSNQLSHIRDFNTCCQNSNLNAFNKKNHAYILFQSSCNNNLRKTLYYFKIFFPEKFLYQHF